MESSDSETTQLLQRAQRGDAHAVEQLMNKHRQRLRRMISVRMDPRLTSRVDPSDVVQETLADASRKLPEYAREQPLPFYPWLRQIAWSRLVDLHHQHIDAKKRSITREQKLDMDVSDESVLDLARQFVSSGTSPSARLVRQELHQRAREAMARMEPNDREVLVMRHLEQMQISEIAAVLNLTESAVKMRRLRAIERLRNRLGVDSQGDMP